MLEAITSRVQAIQGITIRDLYRELFYSADFAAFIIRLNTEGEQTSQLIHGVDSTNTDLSTIGGDYSPYTVAIKQDKGQITDFVTLKDTGYFYRSFRCLFRDSGNGSIVITADTMKETGQDLMTRWGKDILGLDEQNLQLLRERSIVLLREILRRKLKIAA